MPDEHHVARRVSEHQNQHAEQQSGDAADAKAGADAVLLAGKVSSFTSWSASGSVVATSSAEDDAHRRLMRMLADQIVTRLLAQASTLPK